MGRTACTEPQCMYKGALYLFFKCFVTNSSSWYLKKKIYKDLWFRRDSAKLLPNFGVGYSSVVKFTACRLYTWRKDLFGELGVKKPAQAFMSSKVKVTLVQALRLCTGCTVHRGSKGIALIFHDHGTRSGWGVSVTPRPLFTFGKYTIPIVQEAGWAPGPVWTGTENLAPTGIRSPDRPARSQLLYRLSYPAHNLLCGGENIGKISVFACGRHKILQTQRIINKYTQNWTHNCTSIFVHTWCKIKIYW